MSEFDALIDEFVLDAQERLAHLERVLLDVEDADPAARTGLLATAKRELHTIKGNAGMMGLTDLQALAHAMEDRLLATQDAELDVAGLLGQLDAFRSALQPSGAGNGAGTAGGTDAEAGRDVAADDAVEAASRGSVRVPFAALDPLLDQVAELVILRNRLAATVTSGRRAAVGGADRAAVREHWNEVALAQESLGRALDVVQDGVMRLRLTPLQSLFGSLRRLVHDEGARAEKVAVLTTRGGEVPLDKGLLDLANESLGHLVRNALVHGLETPAERARAGKPARGTIALRATVRGDDVWIEVEDDGAGIDPAAIAAAAERKGVVFDPAQPFAPLFEPGFSTRATTDLNAGRGVGLAAVRDAVRRQQGDIEIHSTPGRGTTFRLRLPMTVAIARALLVNADGEIYALPLAAVVESRRLRRGERHEMNGAAVVKFRDRLLPLVDLGFQFGTRPAPREEGYLLVVQAAGRTRAVAVDAIAGMQEVVVRRLDGVVGRPAGVGGSTVLGDGRPILILDPRGLMELAPFYREAA